MKDNDFKVYFVILFCLSSILFFSPTRIDETKTIYTYYVMFFVTICLIAMGFRKPEHTLFHTPIILLLVAALISVFSSFMFWNQRIIESLKPLMFFYTYIIYFLLASWKFRVEDIEKILVYIVIAYFICDSLAYFFYPQPIFGDIKWWDNRGFPRISLPGKGFLFLFSFYSLSKYFNKRELLWGMIFFISIVFIIMTLTRTYIAISFVFLALYALNKSKNFNKIAAILIIAFGFFIISQMNFFRLLSTQTKSETTDIGNNIRIVAADFYLFHYSPNTFTKIFGNGIPYGDSKYAKYIWKLEKIDGLYLCDIGYVGLYSYFGLLSILAYLIIIFKTIKVKVPEEYIYCKYFLYFVFIISIIIDSTFNPSFIIPILFALYILSSKNMSGSIER